MNFTILFPIELNFNKYLNWNSKGEYFSQYAQKKYVKWQSNKYFFKWLEYKKFTKKFKKYYDKRFLGAEATRHKIITNHPNIKVSFVKQIYNWINSNKWIIQKKERLRRSYRKGGKRKIGVFSKMHAKYRLPIWTRLNKVDNRTELGHWEADLILGKRAPSGFENLLVLTERKTRLNIIIKMKSKNSFIVVSLIRKMIKKYNLVVKSITTDNGFKFKNIGLVSY